MARRIRDTMGAYINNGARRGAKRQPQLLERGSATRSNVGSSGADESVGRVLIAMHSCGSSSRARFRAQFVARQCKTSEIFLKIVL
jgi:hypothetical protein